MEEIFLNLKKLNGITTNVIFIANTAKRIEM